VIYESANPHMAILGRLPGTAVYRNIKQYPDAITYPGKWSSFYFGKEAVQNWVKSKLRIQSLLSLCSASLGS
jgi:hypothetical protein